MVEQESSETHTTKGTQTRTLILETALDLFRERGYEETTMRAIAERAGVALGNAYYYFRSKEHLIQAFYGKTHAELLAAARPSLETERTLKGRLLTVMNANLEVIEPYHRFSGILFRTAADPQSPLNPFSAESEQVRKESTALYAEVIDGAKLKIPEDLRKELPFMLWLYHMGIVLFWIHDTSAGRTRTRHLITRTADILSNLITLGSKPFMRPLRKAVLKLMTELKADPPVPGNTWLDHSKSRLGAGSSTPP
ncbi:MAG TPA: TetR family transcriptional regulator [Blastocatellia bacterium]|nr:TetR family transcriptional regulator [Blastocatellia bacterium]